MKFPFVLLVLMMVATQEASGVAITSPMPGDALRGQVAIAGTVSVTNFLSAQLDFSYASDSTGTWFTIQTLDQPVLDSTLATWDTTSITDGDYILRLQVFLTDNTVQVVTVPVKIQNDVPFSTPTPVPTDTPESVFGGQIPTPFLLAASPTATLLPPPTPTAFPTNSVTLNQSEIFTSFGRGALVILGLFAFFGLVLRLRRN